MAVKTFTSGEVLTASDTNTYLNNGGLVYVSATTVGSAVASVTVSSCFSSTYDNYRITYNGGTATANAALQMKLGASTTGYYEVLQYYTYAGAATTLTVNNGANWSYVGEGSTTLGAVFAIYDVMNPFRAYPTQVSGMYPGSVAGFFAGYHSASTSYSDFTIVAGSGTLTGGTITVYGYRKA